jgi:hypothetical protein
VWVLLLQHAQDQQREQAKKRQQRACGALRYEMHVDSGVEGSISISAGIM